MVVTRIKFLAFLSLLLLVSVGVRANEHCHCVEVSVECEHAGELCTNLKDCTDCCDSLCLSAHEDGPINLVSPLQVVVSVCDAPNHPACVVRSVLESSLVPQIYLVCDSRPPALRAGTMSLRV